MRGPLGQKASKVAGLTSGSGLGQRANWKRTSAFSSLYCGGSYFHSQFRLLDKHIGTLR